MKRVFRRRTHPRAGNESLQTVAILAVGALVLIAVMKLWKGNVGGQIAVTIQRVLETANDPKILLAIVTAVFAVLAWFVKDALTTFRLTTQMLILELLSDKKHRTRAEVFAGLRKQRGIYRVYPGTVQTALAHLVSEKRVVITDSKYAKA